MPVLGTLLGPLSVERRARSTREQARSVVGGRRDRRQPHGGILIRGTHGPLVALRTADSPIPQTERGQWASGSAVGPGGEGPLDDCAVLLTAKDPLRGTATLDWSADTAIASWTGVTVESGPRRVTGLSLDGSGLTGSIPAVPGELSALHRAQAGAEPVHRLDPAAWRSRRRA